MYKLWFSVCLLALGTPIFAQNLFPQKIDGCSISEFCLDCGDVKASYDPTSFDQMTIHVGKTVDLGHISGSIILQVLVDSLGHGCVISHSDATHSSITSALIAGLDSCFWTPAREAGRPVASSINIVFDIQQGKISGQVKRISPQALKDFESGPGEPVIYNKITTYTNPSLNLYDIFVWRTRNSPLPNNMSQHSVVDKDDYVWYATFGGLVKYDGVGFVKYGPSNSPFTADEDVRHVAVDSENTKWLSADEGLFRYSRGKWEKVDTNKINEESLNDITVCPDGQVLFCTDNGIISYDKGKWGRVAENLTHRFSKRGAEYAFKDKRGRLWIGTFNGSFMIENDNVTDFNKEEGFLKDICFTTATEDEEGNVYFALYYTNHPDTIRDRPQEGLAEFTKEGKWIHYNDRNSGLPANYINALLYDRFENILWLGTNDAGLVRYDLKTGWENYNNDNSKVPSTYIYALSQDSKGIIYASTYYGMMQIKRKR